MTDAESRACGQVTLILYDAPNHKSSDAGNVEMPERSLHGLPSSENVNILDLIMKEKISYVEIYSKNEFSVHEIVKKEKYALVLLSPHTAKVTSMEKTLESPLDCKEIQPVHSKGNQS